MHHVAGTFIRRTWQTGLWLVPWTVSTCLSADRLFLQTLSQKSCFLRKDNAIFLRVLFSVVYRGQYFLSIFYESSFKDKYMSYFITWVSTNDRFVHYKRKLWVVYILKKKKKTHLKRKKKLFFFLEWIGRWISPLSKWLILMNQIKINRWAYSAKKRMVHLRNSAL